MGNDTLARRERTDLAALLRDLGPDAPTLCEGWATQDLAAHLVVRENRPDAALGIVVPPLAGYTERVQRGAARKGYQALVDTVASGPGRLSVFSLPGVDAAANTAEYLVHHEDVRRAQPDWQPRDLPAQDAELIWQGLPRFTALATRRLKIGLVARDPDGRERRLRGGSPVAVLTGEPLEILLYLFGRQRVAQVEVGGDAEAVAALGDSDLSL